MPLSAGETFAGYRVVRKLGSGGMGEVYLVEHPRLPRRDALKVLPAALSADQEYRERFIREADLAARLWHPHIVGVHDRGEFDGLLWIAMDYVHGSDAGQLTRSQYTAGMPVAQVMTILSAIADALDYAHGQGLLHRDVKPANILIATSPTDQHRIALSDFGIAREIIDSAGLTATNLTVGTVAYAAPEQLMGATLDGNADQYALAATAYHLLTGAPLYGNSNPAAVIGQHLTAPPPRLSTRRPELAALDSVLAKALSKAPADRFATCAEFATALVAASGSDATQATVLRPATGDATVDKHRTQHQRTRKRPVAIATAMAVLAGAAVAAGAYLRSDFGDQPDEAPPMAETAMLNGTYRIQYHDAQSKVMGSPNPTPDDDSERWWAIRTLCNSTACAANGVELDQLDHHRRKAKGRSAELQFIEGHWIEYPQRTRKEIDECSIADDGTKKKGENTIVPVWQLQPQSDGSFRGTSTATVVTSECGLQGAVYETPFTATRVGDIAVDIAIPDPTVDELPTAPEAVPGPVLTGTYQLTYNFSQTRSGGVFNRGEGVSHEWRAYRSLCTTTGCVATVAMLDDANPAEAAGGANVLRFIAGSWTDIPYRVRITCGPDEALEYTTERSLTLEPLPDNTLRGTSKSRILSNECGAQGSWFEVPVTAVRTGEVPPAVSVADPALFG